MSDIVEKEETILNGSIDDEKADFLQVSRGLANCGTAVHRRNAIRHRLHGR